MNEVKKSLLEHYKTLVDEPSKQTLVKLLEPFNNEPLYHLTGYIEEKLLHSTNKNGYDYRYGYEFTDMNNKKFYLKKDDSLFLASCGAVRNAIPNENSDGFIGINENLNKSLKSIVVSPDLYLNNEELLIIESNLRKLGQC